MNGPFVSKTPPNHRHLTEIVQAALSDPFRAPRSCERAIARELGPLITGTPIVFGQYASRAAVLFWAGQYLLVSPGAKDVREQIARLAPNAIRDQSETVAVLSRAALAAIAAAPRILLLNPSFQAFDHIPAPVLGLAVLASTLRRRCLSRIEILDFKLGATAEELDGLLATFDPSIVGVSIDFDEFDAAISLLKQCSAPHRQLVAGNYIARLRARELLAILPSVLIAASEGEEFLLDVIALRASRRAIGEVSGAIYIDPKSGVVRHNPVRPIPLDLAALPAPDTIDQLRRSRAALTMELSRGCSYNACTFCPRDHKSRRWRAASVDASVEAVAAFAASLEVLPNAPRRIYFVDEEFIGYSATEDLTERLRNLSEALARRVPDLKWEINTRVDQIVDPERDSAWHDARWQAIIAAKKAGLSRVLVGVESGSDAVLKRYAKGQTANQSAAAMRILSALAVDVRVTFITYDQLMSPDELAEGFLFLDRKDALVAPQPDGLTALAAMMPKTLPPSVGAVFGKVPYLHNEMKILPDSHFARQVSRAMAAEGWTGPYRFPAVGRAAAVGARWMAAANTLTMALLATGAPSVPSSVRVKTLERIHLASFAVLGVLVKETGVSSSALGQRVAKATEDAFAALGTIERATRDALLSHLAFHLMSTFTAETSLSLLPRARQDALLQDLV